MSESTITPVNSSDRDWTNHRYILKFGAYGDTRLMVWANHLQDALDESIDWLVENEPGLLCDDEVVEEYKRLIAEGKSEEDAMQEAEVDTISGGNCGNRIHSYEWYMIAEDPTRSEVLELQGRV